MYRHVQGSKYEKAGIKSVKCGDGMGKVEERGVEEGRMKRKEEGGTQGIYTLS